MQCLGVQQACLLASAVLNLINEFGFVTTPSALFAQG